jgi:hypothetical protein
VLALAVSHACGGSSIEKSGDEHGGGASGEDPGPGATAGTGRGGNAATSGTGVGGMGRGGTGKGGTGQRGGSSGHGSGGDSGAQGGDGSGGFPGGQAGFGGDDGGHAGADGLGVCRNGRSFSSNLEACDGSFVHRPKALACPPATRDDMIDGLAGSAGYGRCTPGERDEACPLNECIRDADCGPTSMCVFYLGNVDGNLEPADYHRCIALCQTDADCAPNELCACETRVQNATRLEVSIGVCQPAECHTDAECGEQSLCISPLEVELYFAPDTRLTSFHCQTRGDDCSGPEQCPPVEDWPDDNCPEPRCYRSKGRFVCGGIGTCDP